MNRIYLYGLAGAEDKYAVVRYAPVDYYNHAIAAVKMEAEAMLEEYPTVKTIYAVDARGGLGNDYRRAIKEHSIESFMVFKDLLERYGFEVKV